MAVASKRKVGLAEEAIAIVRHAALGIVRVAGKALHAPKARGPREAEHRQGQTQRAHN